MDKIYLLLRNNKQTGPYSVEEIVQMNLKPTDLIWVEGRSAGWRNPIEIDTLKSYVSDLSQQIIQQPLKPVDEKRATAISPDAVVIPKESPVIQRKSKNIFVSLPATFQPSSPAETLRAFPEKPIVLEEPVKVEQPVKAEEPVKVEIQAESMAEKLDKKAEELLERMQAYTREKNLEKNERYPDTRYAPPLNNSRKESSVSREESSDWKHSINFNGDIDKMQVREIEPNDNSNSSSNMNYGNWRKQPKLVEKKVIRKKPILVVIGLLVILAFGIITRSGGENITTSQVETSTPVSANEFEEQTMQPAQEIPSLSYQEDYLPDAKFFEEQMKKDEGITEEAALHASEEKTETPAPIVKDAVQLPTEKESIQVAAEKKEEKKADDDKKDKAIVNKKDNSETQTTIKKDNNTVNKKDDPELQRTAKKDNTTVNKKTEPQLPVATKKDNSTANTTSEQRIKKVEPAVPLTQLISIKGDYLPGENAEGVNGYKLTMQNNSKQVLKVVAVDVFYYGANDKLLNKKTLYFSNVSPGANMILTAPANKWAVTVRHQLGLVSSEEGALYFVKQ